MKKILLLLAAAVGISASAQTTFSGSTLYGYCTTPYAATTLKGKGTMGAAMQLNASTIKAFTGCKITAIAIANGTSQSNNITTVPINLFVGETLTEGFLQTFSGEMDLNKPLQYAEYPLTEPIEITADTPQLFFGFTADCDPGKYNPLVVDAATYDKNAGPGDYIGILDGTAWEWAQLREQIGLNCIRLKIEGEGMKANYVSMIEHHLPTYAQPAGKSDAAIYVCNTAYNAVNSINVKYTVNGDIEHTETITLPRPIFNNEYAGPIDVDIQFPATEGADLPLTIDITGVNTDATNNAAANIRSASNTYLCLTEGYDKAVVIEEATGTWCGWCPLGIVGLEKMAAAYKDDSRYIPIAAHYNDAMAVQSYNTFFGSNYTGGSFPTFMVNRNKEEYGAPNPAFEVIEEIYRMATNVPALCSVDITNVIYNEAAKTLSVDTETQFALSTNGDYAISLVLTEDNVGPYTQTNYYSPEINANAGELEWWDQQPSTVKNVYFDHVARYTNAFRGTKGSIPADITADTKYNYTGTLQTNKVKNINKCHIIALVINRTSNRIENAVMVPFTDYSSINEVENINVTDNDLYYDLQGRRVTRPGHGLYIHNGRKIRL